MTADQRSGFAAVIGRPNTGKSTLVNAMVGQKVAITSEKPQTTRRLVRGIVDRPGGQLVLVDTPGIHRPRTLLGERLNALAEEQWTEVDAIAVCLPADEAIGPGDRRIVSRLAGVTRGGRRVPIVALMTKSDRVGPDRMLTGLTAIGDLGVATHVQWNAVVPVSAARGHQVEDVVRVLLEALPLGAPLFPEGQATDEPEQGLAAELIREAALRDLTDEMPHSVAVVVEEMGMREDRPPDRPLLDIYATLFVERASQKPILLGKGGARLREIGARSRQAIEAMFEVPVFLDLHVKIAKEWQRDPKALRRLGF